MTTLYVVFYILDIYKICVGFISNKVLRTSQFESQSCLAFGDRQSQFLGEIWRNLGRQANSVSVWNIEEPLEAGKVSFCVEYRQGLLLGQVPREVAPWVDGSSGLGRWGPQRRRLPGRVNPALKKELVEQGTSANKTWYCYTLGHIKKNG